MEEIENILSEQAKRYPLMEPQDCVKLIYQNEFGAKHAAKNADYVMQQLQEEYESVQADAGMPLIEPIGNYRCRLNLARAKTILTAGEIGQWFLTDAKCAPGSLAEFMDKLKLFKKHWAEYGFNYTQDQVDEFLSWYRSHGYPSVHHSTLYKKTYDPHYRVMFQRDYQDLSSQASSLSTK
ncbi:MAG: hypothetical protein LKF79_04320 [Solobacterium sp.]|jgi:hypothetical protein|nr:hypothetical protein [Solobacterium sp.]MCH4222447.1 hypothetical protein [Solobacterium sp.]MCH4265851.1 hypothetical protein [Solobacterium sp.]